MDPRLWQRLLGDANRRAVLKRLGALGLAAALPVGCDDAPAAAPVDAGVDGAVDLSVDHGVDAGPEPLEYFEVLRRMQAALRTSPDHLPARAEALVAAGDPQALYAFVRDEIALHADEGRRIDGLGSLRVQLFGPRATLRAGGGSARDKCDLLVHLLDRAGVQARVIQGRPPRDADDLHAWLLRPYPRVFEPQVDPAERAAWVEALGLDPEPTLPPALAIEGPAAALADALSPLLPDARIGRADFDWRLPNLLPVVEAQIDGAAVPLCPLMPDLPFGAEWATDLQPLADDRQGAPLPVTLRVEGAWSTDPSAREVLVEGAWTSAEVTGRQIALDFRPTVPTAALFQTALRQVPAFLPTLSLQALDLPEPLPEAAVIGPAFTPGGQRIAVDGDRVTVNGQPIAGPGAASGQADAVAEVARLAIDPGGFDTVRVRCHPVDAQGALVEGLTAADVQLTEDGVAQPCLVLANALRPRVALFIDQSLSMPAEWRGEDAVADFAAGLSAAVQAEFAGASVQVQANNDSRLWANLAAATYGDPTVIVYVTDGDIDGQATPALEAVIRNGPPAVIVHVTDARRADLEAMAALSGGAVAATPTPEGAAEAVAGFLRAAALPGYTLSYQAPAGPPGERQVTVQIGAGAADGRYTPPAEAAPRRLIGLYLTVQVGDDTVTRTLAGMPERAAAPDADAWAQVQGLLWSRTLVAFEAGRAPESVLLDELIQARLDQAPVLQALDGGDSQAFLEALDRGVRWLPSDLSAVHPPLQRDATQATFETGPRVILCVDGPQFHSDRYGRRLDVLPLSPIATATDGEALAVAAATLRQSARLAAAEAALGARSTLGLLQGAELALSTDVNYFSRRDDLSDTVKARWAGLLREQAPRGPFVVPTAGLPVAFWAIDRDTGGLLGVLEDGSGGAHTYNAIVETVDEVRAFADHLRTLKPYFSAAGALNPGFGAIGRAMGGAAAVGEYLARLYGTATVVIASLDAYEVPELFREDLFATACGAIQQINPGGHWEGISAALGALILNDPSRRCIGSRRG